MSDETQAQIPPELSREERLEQVLAEYLRQVEQGVPVDQQALLAAHPDLADDLREFFGNQMRMQRLVGPAPTSRNGTPTRLRYFGDYEILEEIAHGGMGVVYKARQTSLNRIVAVKMILAGQLANESDVKRFQAEAEAAANLHHPGVVGIYEVGVQDGQHYYSMEYINGQNLAQAVREKPLSVTQAAEYVRDIAIVLEYAHQQKVLHRDLKPSNILIDGSGRLRITDFGLAKRVEGESDLTMTGQVLGTPSYMSPEQAAAQHAIIGPPTDIYALGAILYELVTGRPPFRSENVGEILRQVQHDEPVRPRLLNPKLPRDLETICLKCLEKEPRRRYGSAQLLADDLGRYLRGEPIVARPARAWERGIKWVRRHPTAAGLVFVSTVAILSLVSVGVGQHYNNQLQTVNGELASAKSSLETRNAQLQGAKASLETSNKELATASGKLETALNDVKAERANARKYLYTARMTLVQRAQKENQPGRIVQLLRSVIPETPEQEDLRDFEWYHLWRKYHGEESRLRGHTGPVTAVAFSPNDKWLASGSTDHSLRVWNVATGLEHWRLTGHRGEVKSLAFSSNGDQLISASVDGFLKLWNVDRGQEIQSINVQPLLEKEARLTACAFCPDGKHIASRSEDGKVLVWDLAAGKSIAEWSKTTARQARSLAFHPEGRTLAFVNNGSIHFWEPLHGKDIPIRDAVKLSGQANTNIAYSPDGKRLISGYTDHSNFKNGVVTVWDVEKKSPVWSISCPAIITCVAYSPSGDSFAVAGLDQAVRIWNAATGEETCVLFAQDAVRSIAYSPDGSRIVAGTEDRLVMVWSVPKLEERILHEGKPSSSYTSAANSVSFGAGGRALGALCNKEGLIWNARTGRQIQRIEGGARFRRIALAPTSSWIAGVRSDSLTEAFTGIDGIPLRQAKKDRDPTAISSAMAYAVSQDETLVAEASGADMARVYNASTGELTRTFALRDWVSSVAFSPDSKLLAVGSGYWDPGADNRGALQVWEIKSGETILPKQNFSLDVWWLAFSPDGTLLAAAMGDYRHVGTNNPGRIRIWNTSTWEVVYDLRGHSRCVWSLAFNPRGTRLASAGGQGNSPVGEVKVWDVSTGEEVLTIPDQDGAVFGVAFSPDGRRLATASHSGAVKLLDGTPLAESPSYEPLPKE